jgi:excisionase family DNA binding protein
MSDGNELLTVHEAAEMLRMPKDSLRYRMHTGAAPVSVKIGRRRLFRRADVERWIQDQYDRQIA